VRKGEFESRVLILLTLALVAFGIVCVYSATSAAAAVGGGNTNYYVERQALYAVVGIALMVVLQHTDFRFLKKLAPILVVASLGLLVVVLAMPPVNGARRWITIGPAVFQPSELAKLALAVWAAAHLSRRSAPRTLTELKKPIGYLAIAYAGLLLLEPDMGTAITLLMMLGAMLLVAGTPGRVLVPAFSLAAAAGMIAMWAEPYRRARFLAFLNPWDDAQGAGFQITQAMIGMGSGGIFGVGMGNGIQKVFYLPEAPSDMMLANIGEELGLIGVTGVLLAYLAYGWLGFRIALNCRDPFGKRLAVGLTALVCGQALVNISAVMGVAPLTGIPLPFLSAGGSSLIVLLTSAGILLNIAARGNEKTASVRHRSRRDSGARPARARSSGSADETRRPRDVRRVAGSR